MLSGELVQRLTDHAVRLHAARDLHELGRATTEALRDLIPCDWPVVSLATTHFPPVRYSYSTAHANWNEYADLCLKYAHEDPVYTNRLRLLLDRPASPTEFVDRADLESTAIFNDVWRPIGAQSLLRFLSPGRFNYRLEVGRERDRAFTEDDATIMHALARHLEGATDRMVERHGGTLPAGGSNVPVQMFSWLVCDARGRVLRAMPHAVRLMRACLGPEAALDRLPPAWMAELERRIVGRPPTPMWHVVDGCPVTVHIAPIRPTTDEFSVGFLERPAAADPVERLMTLGITRREAEVLRRVAEGETNRAIAEKLGMSPLTAKKHLENVFHKLGVENRTAAVVLALQALGGQNAGPPSRS